MIAHLSHFSLFLKHRVCVTKLRRLELIERYNIISSIFSRSPREGKYPGWFWRPFRRVIIDLSRAILFAIATNAKLSRSVIVRSTERDDLREIRERATGPPDSTRKHTLDKRVLARYEREAPPRRSDGGALEIAIFIEQR